MCPISSGGTVAFQTRCRSGNLIGGMHSRDQTRSSLFSLCTFMKIVLNVNCAGQVDGQRYQPGDEGYYELYVNWFIGDITLSRVQVVFDVEVI